MARVHTAHGVGEIIQTETVRGRTSHLVKGAGFRAWVPATGCRTASDINESNSTTLPYDPTPQYPSDMWSTQATILPGDQEIDAEERLSASDSLDFDSRREHTYPGPDPTLFAGDNRPWKKNAALQVGPWTDDDWEQAEAHDPTDEYRNHPDSWDHEPTEEDYAEWEARRRQGAHLRQAYPGAHRAPPSPEMVLDQGEEVWDSEDWLDAHPAPQFKDPREQARYEEWMESHIGDAELHDRALNTYEPIHSDELHSPGGRHRAEDFRGPLSPGDDAGIARNPYTGDTETGSFVGDPEGRGHWDPEDRTRFANLDPKYATWMLSAARTTDDDSISRFRRDPIGEINRLGSIWSTSSADDTIEEYGRLIQADKMLRESAWADVRAKANRLRSQGRIRVQHRQAGNIYATVDGDHGTYTTLVSSNGPGQSVGSWVCSCPWGMWAWKRKVSFVGRFCSHGYGAYQELRAGAPRDTKGRFASVTDDFQQYVDDYRGGHIDQDGADTFIGMPDNSLTDSDVADLYDYVEGNHTERADRPFGDPPAFPDGPLRTTPATLTPDLFRVPTPDASFFVDVEKDERSTTGPDTIMSDKDWKTAAYVDALGNPYGPRIRRTAVETTVEDDEKNGGTVAPAEAAAVDTTTPAAPKEEPAMRGSFDPSMVTSIVGPVAQGVGSIVDSLTGTSLASGIGGAVGSMVSGIGSGLGGFFTASVDDDLEHLRELSDSLSLGHMDSHNDEVRKVIDALHEEGTDASQIVASSHDNEGPVPGNDDIRYHLPASGSGPKPKDWNTTSEEAIALIGPGENDTLGSHTDEDVTDLSDGPYITASREEGFGGVEDQDPELSALMAEITDGVSEGDEPNDYLFDSSGRYRRERFKKAWRDGDADDPRTEAGLPPRGKSEGNRNFAENLGGPEPEEAAEKWEEGWDEYSQPTKKAAGREESDIVRRFHASGAAEAINGPTRSDDDIAGQARKFLAKTAGRVYSLAEQQELIDEPGTARNKPTREDLLGTHYVP